ncbi:MAG: hypothetical protein RAO92_05060 [Candidatus Euphemobacter frigidus]|nr:hypothetical protein [Candidatus Euphemobacter frigidus]MDP8275753.1 hypothetical protein [Candidatus Euphemobacter frigidus]
MDFLKPCLKNQQITYYRLFEDYPEQIQSYILSTSCSRDLLNRPEIFGCEFTRSMRKIITLALEYFPEREAIRSLEPTSISVIHFLRSGLNFAIRESLYDAIGFNTHLSSFLTSQRQRNRFGRWYIKDDQYRKLEIPEGASLFIGEIVATGVTVQNGFDIIFRLAKNLGRSVRNVFFFTIGCHKAEKTLRKYDILFRSVFPNYQKTYLVYIEGKFHLADSKTKVAVKLQGTDLLRSPALLAPEFELSQFRNLSYPLERCVIYDGGARAFNVPEYLEDVRSYWEKMLELAHRGLTLKKAFAERWPADEYELPFARFAAAKKKTWRGISHSLLQQLYRAHQDRWTDEFKRRAATSQPLINLCRRRLRNLGDGLEK